MKKFKTNFELAQNFKEKFNLKDDIKKIEELFNKYGYNNLVHGYLKLTKMNNTFAPNYLLTELITIYLYNIKVSDLLFRPLLNIEVNLKAFLSGNLNLYIDKTIKNDIANNKIRKIMWNLILQEKNNNIFLKAKYSANKQLLFDFKQNSNNYIRPYVLIDALTFGDLYIVIKNLSEKNFLLKLKENLNFEKIATKYFFSIIKLIILYRNAISHNARIIFDLKIDKLFLQYCGEKNEEKIFKISNEEIQTLKTILAKENIINNSQLSNLELIITLVNYIFYKEKENDILNKYEKINSNIKKLKCLKL